MSAAAISTDLRTYAVKRWPTANHKFRKGRLADLLGFSERRVRSFWEGTAAAPRDEEIEAIHALVGANEQIEEANRDAYAALQERIARLEAIILAQSSQQDHPGMAGQGEGTHRRRRADVARIPFTDADERASQAQGWGS